MKIAAALFALCLTAPAVAAEPPVLSLPLACTLGETCWMMNYADADPGPAAKDFACRPRSYNGHDGTDFAVRDVAAQARGVAVLAAAAGRVVSVRDGEPDGLWMAGKSQQVLASGKECGNRVAVAHGDGWVTDYCHLRQGSVTVKPGDQVAAGQPMALVGLSGMTAFPHAHLGVLHFPDGQSKGVAMDPFTGAALSAGCGQAAHSLWAQPVAYEPVALYAAGFADAVPAGESIKAQAASPPTLPATSPALVVWGALFGISTGDRVSVRLVGPGGAELLSQTIMMDRDQAWRLVALGKKRPGERWPSGAYGGTVTLERPQLPAQTRNVTVTVP